MIVYASPTCGKSFLKEKYCALAIKDKWLPHMIDWDDVALINGRVASENNVWTTRAELRRTEQGDKFEVWHKENADIFSSVVLAARGSDTIHLLTNIPSMMADFGYVRTVEDTLQMMDQQNAAEPGKHESSPEFRRQVAYDWNLPTEATRASWHMYSPHCEAKVKIVMRAGSFLTQYVTFTNEKLQCNKSPK